MAPRGWREMLGRAAADSTQTRDTGEEGALRNMMRSRSTRGRKVFALSLAVVAVLGLSAISASGAQALSWQRASGTNSLKVLSGTETQSIAGTGSITVSSTVFGTPTKIECGASNKGSIGANGVGTSNISLTGCVVATPSKCELASAPTLKANIALVEVGGKLFQKFTPATESTFGTLVYAGKECSLNEAEVPLKGSFAGSESSTELSKTHTLVFTKSEPWPEVELKLATKAATMTGSLVGQHLSGTNENLLWRPLWQTTHGAWEIEVRGGTPLVGTESALMAGGPVSFQFTLLGNSISFSCSTPSASSAVLHPGNTETFGSISFAGCKVEPATCSLSGNKLQLPEMTGTLVSISGKTYLKLAPTHPVFKEGQEQPWMYWSFQGASCPWLEISMPVYKSMIALGPELGGLATFQPFQFSTAASELLPLEERMRVGKESTVNVNGTVLQEFSGAQAGLPWGAY